MPKQILIVVDSMDVNDSSGSKANVALIKNLQATGYLITVLHYTQKDFSLKGVQCVSIKEKKYNLTYFLSRTQRVIQRHLKINLAKYLEPIFGFSFTFFNDVNSIKTALKNQDISKFDLVLTLSKGASYRPHYAVLKLPELHYKWMAYVHDPYPFHFYPRPYTWVEPGYKFKEIFFFEVSEKAKYSGFPSQLLLEWMGSYFPNFIKTGIIIPHQNAEYNLQNKDFPDYFDVSKFNLLHAGNLLKQRSPKDLIKGFKLFLDKNPEAKMDSKLILIGNAPYHTKMLEAYKVDTPEIYIYNGNVAFDIVYNLQMSVSVNIILESKSEISPFLPAKFPHCVEANKTILLLAPYYSETKRLLGDNYPYWSEVDNVEKIAFLIEAMYELWKTKPDDLLLNRNDLSEYLSTDYLKNIIIGLKDI